MARRIRNPFLNRSLQRTLGAVARSAMRAGARAVKQALKAGPKPPEARVRSPAAKSRPINGPRLPGAASPAAAWTSGAAVGAGGARRYWLFKPPGVARTECLPLLVMLHGCGQDAQALATSSRMNQIAARERFLVLYPEQDRLANPQRCWNWYDTRSGRAQAEAATLEAAIQQVCLSQPVDTQRVALAGLSAGASMAVLLAIRHPERYRAVVMHSGVAPGVAHSTATALSAMRGRRAAVPLAPPAAGTHLPALLVIHGSADHVVAPVNGLRAAELWATSAGATAALPRTVQRGQRYSSAVTDYRAAGRLVATLWVVQGLGHAWSGGVARHAYSNPQGPDAARIIWAFAARQFTPMPPRVSAIGPS